MERQLSTRSVQHFVTVKQCKEWTMQVALEKEVLLNWSNLDKIKYTHSLLWL